MPTLIPSVMQRLQISNNEFETKKAKECHYIPSFSRSGIMLTSVNRLLGWERITDLMLFKPGIKHKGITSPHLQTNPLYLYILSDEKTPQ
jgi:hypothetical protein